MAKRIRPVPNRRYIGRNAIFRAFSSPNRLQISCIWKNLESRNMIFASNVTSKKRYVSSFEEPFSTSIFNISSGLCTKSRNLLALLPLHNGKLFSLLLYSVLVVLAFYYVGRFLPAMLSLSYREKKLHLLRERILVKYVRHWKALKHECIIVLEVAVSSVACCIAGKPKKTRRTCTHRHKS
jgi:hypothetical protein